MLQLADHFFQQYAHLCPDRKPLFIHPLNECGVQVWGVWGWATARAALAFTVPNV